MTDREAIEKMTKELVRLRKAQTGERGLWPLKLILIASVPGLLYHVFVTMRPQILQLFGF